MFPDTVFFEEGKPSFIARVDKEGCMIKVTNPAKLTLQDIRSKFPVIVRDRRKETGLFQFSQAQGKNNNNSFDPDLQDKPLTLSL